MPCLSPPLVLERSGSVDPCLRRGAHHPGRRGQRAGGRHRTARRGRRLERAPDAARGGGVAPRHPALHHEERRRPGLRGPLRPHRGQPRRELRPALHGAHVGEHRLEAASPRSAGGLRRTSRAGSPPPTTRPTSTAMGARASRRSPTSPPPATPSWSRPSSCAPRTRTSPSTTGSVRSTGAGASSTSSSTARSARCRCAGPTIAR